MGPSRPTPQSSALLERQNVRPPLDWQMGERACILAESVEPVTGYIGDKHCALQSEQLPPIFIEN
jgi:hypothetical protein